MASEHADIAVVPLRRALLDSIGAPGDDPEAGLGQRVDLAVLPCFTDERPLQGLLGLLDWRWSGHLSAVLRGGFFEGGVGDALLMPAPRTVPIERLVLVGLGRAADFDRTLAEATGERLVAMVAGLAPRDVLVAMPGPVSERVVVEAMFHGLTRALVPAVAEPDDVVAQPAARAVGEDASIGLVVEPEPEPDPPPDAPDRTSSEVVSLDAPRSERAGNSPTSSTTRTTSDEAGASRGVARSTRSPEAGPAADPDAPDVSARVRRWWVVADPRHEARLRRLLEGPPRAAGI